MKNKIILSLVVSILMIGSVSAVGETLHPNSSKEVPNLESTAPEKQGLFDSITSSLLSVTTSTSGPFEPGELIEFDSEVVVEDNSVKYGEAVLVTEFYKCLDSGCDDGSSDEFLGAERSFIDDGTDYYLSGDWSSSMDWQAPSDTGYYAAVAYMYDTADGVVVSDEPEKIFEVREPSKDSDGDGVIDSNDDCIYESGTESNDGCPVEKEPDVSFSQTPSFTVDQEANTVTGTLGIQNTGNGDMSDSDIVEMQVRPYGEGPLSFVSSSVDTCDSSYPNNVHKSYSIDSGGSESISLTNQGSLSDGESYTVYFMTRESCGGAKTEPIYNSFNAGTFTFEEEQVSEPEPEPEPEPSVVEHAAPKLSYNDGTISTEVSFKNNGGDMTDSRILEMQVRPKGSTPLSFSSTTSVCDPAHPENVHKSFKLGSGEEASTTLSTSAVTDEGEYTVYLLTRSGCGGEKVEPYYNSVRAGTVTIESDAGFVDYVEDNPLPVTVVAIGLLLVVGGAIYRWV